jgi:tetratricopeptide (TPR) repeat protein
MRKLKAVFIPLSFALLLALYGGQASAQSQQADEVERALDRAVESHKAGDLAGAIRQYQAILARNPGRVDVRSNLGAAFVQLGRFEEAIAEYKRALASDGRNTAIRFNLALAFYKAANFAEAVNELKQVVAEQPENANAVLLLADCQLRLGEDKQVIELLTPLDAKLGGNPVFNYVLGTALIYDKQIEKGQVLIDRILRGGDSAEVRVLMGAAHMMTQDYPSALKEFERARELNPQVPTLHALYGRALMLTGETERAEQAFRRELEINPNDFESNLYIGMLLKKEAKNDEALVYLERAARVRPKEVNARYNIGSIYMTTGKVAEAQRLLEQIVQEAPDFVEARVLLATAYYRLKRKEDGDRERVIIQKLTAERQARQPGAQEGEVKNPPALPKP